MRSSIGRYCSSADQPLAVHRRPEQPQRLVDAQPVVLGGALQVDAVLRRFRHPLEPVEQLLRGEVLRVVELDCSVFSAPSSQRKVFFPMKATFNCDSSGCLKWSSLSASSKTACDRRLVELEFERQFVVRRLAVLGIARSCRASSACKPGTLLGNDLEIEKPRAVGRPGLRPPREAGSEPLHETCSGQPAVGGFMRRVADGHRQRIAGVFRFDRLRQPQQIERIIICTWLFSARP